MTDTTKPLTVRLARYADQIEGSEYVTNRLALDIRAVLRDGQAMRDDNARLRNELGDARNQQAYMAELFDSDITGAGLKARLETGDACLQAMLALGWPRDTGISAGEWIEQHRAFVSGLKAQITSDFDRAEQAEKRAEQAEIDRSALAADLDRARSEVASWKLRDHERTAEVGAWMLRLGRRDGESWDKAVDRIEADRDRIQHSLQAAAVCERSMHERLHDRETALRAFGWTPQDLPAAPWAQQSAAARMATLKDMEAQIERLNYAGRSPDMKVLAMMEDVRGALRGAGVPDSTDLVAGVRAAVAGGEKLWAISTALVDAGCEGEDSLEAVKRLLAERAESATVIRGQAEENGELVRTLGVINAMLRDEPVVREVVFDLGRLTSIVIKDVIAGLKGARLRVVELEADNERLKNTIGEYMAQWQEEMLDPVREAMPEGYTLVCDPEKPDDSRAWFSWHDGRMGPKCSTPWAALKGAWMTVVQRYSEQLDVARTTLASVQVLVNKPPTSPVSG